MDRIIHVSLEGRRQIQRHEKLVLKPYLCPAGYPTIGYGNTYYEDGTRVRMTDPPISEARADKLFMTILETYERGVDSVTRDDINQRQFDALVSFAYNVGLEAFKRSTLLKRINAYAPAYQVRAEFMRWNRANGNVMAGLTKRRQAEADWYFA